MVMFSIVVIGLLVMWHEREIKQLKEELEHTRIMVCNREVGADNE